MLVQRVVMPVTGAESWTVLGDDGGVVVPVERYLAYLGALERSPNTVRAYATSLRLWFEFLGQAGVAACIGVLEVNAVLAWPRRSAMTRALGVASSYDVRRQTWLRVAQLLAIFARSLALFGS